LQWAYGAPQKLIAEVQKDETVGLKNRKNAMRKPEGLLLLQPNEKQTHKLPADKTGRAHCLTLKTAKSWPNKNIWGQKRAQVSQL